MDYKAPKKLKLKKRKVKAPEAATATGEFQSVETVKDAKPEMAKTLDPDYMSRKKMKIKKKIGFDRSKMSKEELKKDTKKYRKMYMKKKAY